MISNHVAKDSCGRNLESEEDQWGLDSTIISNYDMMNNSLAAPYLNDFNFDMLEPDYIEENSNFFENLTNQ